MERRAFHDLFLVMLVLATTYVVVKGFHTEKCDHQSLASNVKSLAICIDEVQLAAVEDIVESAEGEAGQRQTLDLKSLLPIAQNSASDLVKCMDVFSEACFQTGISGLIVQVFAEILLPRPRVKYVDSNFGYIRPGFGEWNATSWRVVDFHFDKGNEGCKFHELEKNVGEVVKCFQGDGPQGQAILCNILDEGIKSCMDVSQQMYLKSHQCFSKQEMELLRDLIATIHTMAMKDFIRLNEKFGNSGLAVNAFVIAIDKKQRRTPGFQEREKDWSLADVSVDDFRNGSVCQTTLMEHSMVSSSPLLLPLLSIHFTATLSIFFSKL